MAQAPTPSDPAESPPPARRGRAQADAVKSPRRWLRWLTGDSARRQSEPESVHRSDREVKAQDPQGMDSAGADAGTRGGSGAVAQDTNGTSSVSGAVSGLDGGEMHLSSAAMASLAMRELTLVESLLDVVENLEGETEDPDLLAKLFKMDNLATRMRRNGENLLVLAGQGPEDPHVAPMPVLDVARAAISEIGDYNRVQVGQLPESQVAGPIADDLAHLLAELLDNATAKSPEHAQVVVSGQPMADGKVLVAVEDEGIGVPSEHMAQLNARLRGQTSLDEAGMRHMGLYVVSRIAQRHGIQVQLEQRAFRGMSAFVVIPEHLLRKTVSSQPVVPGSGPEPEPVSTKDPRPSVEQQNSAATTAAGLPRRSARTVAAPPLLDSEDAADDAPVSSSGVDGNRAQQISDDIGGFLAGERAAANDEQ